MIVPGGVDAARLRALVLAELKKAGLKHRAKKTIFKNVKDMKTVFGAPLSAVALRTVSCCGSSLSVPAVVVELCNELRENANVEGLFRKAGSCLRQKDIRRLLDCGGSVSAASAHPIDVAALLKLYLRSLPEPLVGNEVQELLLRCRLAADMQRDPDESLHHLMNTLMLLPVLHLHLLHYVMELLNAIASQHTENLMDATNLAIVMTPSIMPLPTATTSSAQRLQHHQALVKIFIENSKHIGCLTEAFLTQLEGDEVSLDQARRKKRRSGSLNRVLNGLRKMVGASERPPPTPAYDVDCTRTPIICKSASKRKLDGPEGLSAKTKKEIKKNLATKEISFTPRKMGKTERKKIRLSMMDTPLRTEQLTSESSASSEDLLTSPDNLFTTHDTIDLSDSKLPEKDYVKIPKQEYEEIKSRVSAIESRLSKEWTDIPVKPLQQVQNVYEQTLEDVAALNYSSSDQLARRLSKELNIRPTHHTKIVRSPSARKIGTIRRRSKENIKLVRHKSWNVSSQSQANGDADRFYPYVGLKRGRPNALASGLPERKTGWKAPVPETTPASDLDNPRHSHVLRRQSARDLTSKQSSFVSEREHSNVSDEFNMSPSKQKWRSAAAYFMERTGESDNIALSGRPSVNKLRSQNAGAVLAKAKLFESSSDRSSESLNSRVQTFARRPRISGPQTAKLNKCGAPPVLKVKPNSARIVENDTVSNIDSARYAWDSSSGSKRGKNSCAANLCGSLPRPAIKKPLCVKSPRSFRTPLCASETRRVATPLRAPQNTSPRRHSPRFKAQSSLS